MLAERCGKRGCLCLSGGVLGPNKALGVASDYRERPQRAVHLHHLGLEALSHRASGHQDPTLKRCWSPANNVS